MSAMKAIYTDIQELQIAAMGDEDSFIAYIEEMGWKSPTEVEIQRRREQAGVKLPAIHSNTRMLTTERAAVSSVA